MSEDEQDNGKDFLSRWSQRKREAKLQDTGDAVAKPLEDTEAQTGLTTEGAADEPFDLSSLPKLEDITEVTDITAFLRRGVPESLRNAALRKAWASDSAIRNYVNPALDYAYDWNTPGGVPGNSELAPGTDIAKMVQQIMGSDSKTEDADRSDVLSHRRDAVEPASSEIGIDAPEDVQPDLSPQQLRLSDLPTGPTSVSRQDENMKQVQVENSRVEESPERNAPQQQVRRHGTAKPRI
ncbi:DUF3306 domain-containing protein [Bradyrhizobium sp. SYSU BS000235]|uniref:DUF3306 domain-containing protein n=1 Tax=Bradyrhizobium sp. SYSU BS000235 TaxID=3411332 RepID=UPI003C726464